MKQEENNDYDNYNELSPEQQMLRKLDILRKLGELAQYGVKLSHNYNMNSDYFTMKYEYQLHTNIRSKQNFINWTSSIMLNCIYGLEILNEKLLSNALDSPYFFTSNLRQDKSNNVRDLEIDIF